MTNVEVMRACLLARRCCETIPIYFAAMPVICKRAPQPVAKMRKAASNKTAMTDDERIIAISSHFSAGTAYRTVLTMLFPYSLIKGTCEIFYLFSHQAQAPVTLRHILVLYSYGHFLQHLQAPAVRHQCNTVRQTGQTS